MAIMPCQRHGIPLRVALYVVHDWALQAWEETVATCPWELPKKHGTNLPDVDLGNLVARMIRSMSLQGPPPDTSAMEETAEDLSQYGINDMHDDIMLYIHEINHSLSSLSAPYECVAHGIRIAICQARFKAVDSFYKGVPVSTTLRKS